MKRIKVEYADGFSTIIYSARRDGFFCYEEQAEEIHEIYGGKKYYTSRTGMSGAGYLEPEPKDNDIILFGCYRQGKGGQMISQVHNIDGDHPIFGYVPIKGHTEIVNSRVLPFVLTDGRKVAFVEAWEVKETILSWQKIEGKEINVPLINIFGNKENLYFSLYNPHKYRGVRATRFVDLRWIREQMKSVELEDLADNNNVFAKKLSISRLSISEEAAYKNWYHLNLDRVFDRVWNTSPREIIGEIISGWNSEGDGFYWRRAKNGIDAFMEIERSSLTNGKYVVEDETQNLLNFEEFINVLEWYSKDISFFKKYFKRKCTLKARKDYVFAKKRKEESINIRELMERNLDTKICIQDSLDSGNCLSGTEDFIKRYKIQLDHGYCLVRNILKNTEVKALLKNFDFQKVILSVLYKA